MANATITSQAYAGESDPDADILACVSSGDLETALLHLMKRHRGTVHALCQREIGDSSLADDVTQQVFIEVFRDLPHFHGRSSVRTWLLAIARHRALDAARSRRRAHARVADDEAVDLTQIPDPKPSAADNLDDLRLRQILLESLGNLDQEIRVAVVLRYMCGMTFDDMAEVCHEKPNTLHARVTRTLVRLRTKIRFRMARPGPVRLELPLAA